VSPRSLEVRPTYRRRRLWPWIAGAVALLVLGLWELRLHRTRPSESRGPATGEGARPTRPGPAAGTTRGGTTPMPEKSRAEVSGRVLAPDGRPAAGVTVFAPVSGNEVRTGDDGGFRLDAEKGAQVRLEAHHSDLGFAAAEVRAPASGLELRMRARAGVEVQVRSEGHAVPGASIAVRQRGGEAALFQADRATDANGTLRFLGLPAGLLEVEATSPETGARSALQLEARDGAVAQAKLFLPVVGVVRGRVVTRSEAPVAGAFVGVEEAEGLPARTADDGTFVLKGLRPGHDYRLTARTPDLVLDTPVTARAGQSDVRLVVRDRPVFRGRVIGPGGTPLRTFSIDGKPFDAADGRFAVPLEPRDGQVRIQVGADGMETRTVQAGSTLSELGDIALQAAPRIAGKVTVASGEPVPDAEVSVGQDSTRTDAGGAFTLAVREPPRPGSPLFVHAVKGDLAGSARGSLFESVNIVVSGEQAVRFRIIAPSGGPAVGRTVQLTGPRTYAWTTGPEGTVEGKALAGDYRVTVDAQPGRVWFVRLPAPEIVLGAAAGSASLEVEVTTPVEALWVEKGTASEPLSTERPGPRGEGQLLFGVERSARFDGLSPGTWTVVGMRQGVPALRIVQVAGPTRLSL